MAENSRIDDLRRRVQKDPASIAFAQLAEECRRAGEYQEAVDICRAGLEIHPGYLSARVTLGRALVELGQLDEAQAELVACARQRAGKPGGDPRARRDPPPARRTAEALAQYRAALLLARNDPDLEETIADLSRQVEPAKPAASGGLTIEHMQDELLKHTPSQRPKSPPPVSEVGARHNPAAGSRRPVDASLAAGLARIASSRAREDAAGRCPAPAFAAGGARSVVRWTPSPDDRATRTVAALEQWLAAIHVARAHRQRLNAVIRRFAPRSPNSTSTRSSSRRCRTFST